MEAPPLADPGQSNESNHDSQDALRTEEALIAMLDALPPKARMRYVIGGLDEGPDRAPTYTNQRTIYGEQLKHYLAEHPDEIGPLFKERISSFIEKEVALGRTLEDIERYFDTPDHKRGPDDIVFEIAREQFVSSNDPSRPNLVADVYAELIALHKKAAEARKAAAAGTPSSEQNGSGIRSDAIAAEAMSGFEERPNSKHPEQLVHQTIANHLSYADVIEEAELRENTLEFNLNSPDAKKYAASILDLAHKHSLKTVEALADNLSRDASEIVKALGVTSSRYHTGKTWAMWAIGKQYYYTTNKVLADSGFRAGDPVDAQDVQLDIVDRHVGRQVYEACQEGDAAKKAETLKVISIHAHMHDTELLASLVGQAPNVVSDTTYGQLGALLRDASFEQAPVYGFKEQKDIDSMRGPLQEVLHIEHEGLLKYFVRHLSPDKSANDRLIDNLKTFPAIAEYIKEDPHAFAMIAKECSGRKLVNEKEVEALLHNTTLAIEEMIRDASQVRERLLQSPVATDEEYRLGAYKESIVSSLRDAVFVLAEKGYAPVASGFKEYRTGSQYLCLDLEPRKDYLPLFKALEDLKGWSFEARQGKIYITVTPSDPKMAPDAWKALWDDIARRAPQLPGEKAFCDSGLSGRRFRKAQMSMKNKENTYLGSGLSFVDGRVIRMGESRFVKKFAQRL
jgi:hypothetical protein